MRKHILLIDDEDDIREVTAVSLETTAGWQVSSAGSGVAGIELAKKARHDARPGWTGNAAFASQG